MYVFPKPWSLGKGDLQTFEPLTKAGHICLPDGTWGCFQHAVRHAETTRDWQDMRGVPSSMLTNARLKACKQRTPLPNIFVAFSVNVSVAAWGQRAVGSVGTMHPFQSPIQTGRCSLMLGLSATFPSSDLHLGSMRLHLDLLGSYNPTPSTFCGYFCKFKFGGPFCGCPYTHKGPLVGVHIRAPDLLEAPI